MLEGGDKAKRVVLADDHPALLRSLRALVQADGRFVVVATCSDGLSALETIRQKNPDIAVLDISMPGLTGFQVLAEVHDATRVILLTASVSDDEAIAAAVQGGAWGFLLKETAGDMLLDCMAAVSEGRRWLQASGVTH